MPEGARGRSSCISLATVLYFEELGGGPEHGFPLERQLRRILERAGKIEPPPGADDGPEQRQAGKTKAGEEGRPVSSVMGLRSGRGFWRDKHTLKEYGLAEAEAGRRGSAWCVWRQDRPSRLYRVTMKLGGGSGEGGAGGSRFLYFDAASDPSKFVCGEAVEVSAAWGLPFRVREAASSAEGIKRPRQAPPRRKVQRPRPLRAEPEPTPSTLRLPLPLDDDADDATLDGLRTYLDRRLAAVCDQAAATLLRDKLSNPKSRVAGSQVKTEDNVHLLEEIIVDRVIFAADMYPLTVLATLPDGPGRHNPYAFLADLFTEFSLQRPADTEWPEYVCQHISAHKPQLALLARKIGDRRFTLGLRAAAEGLGGPWPADQETPMHLGQRAEELAEGACDPATAIFGAFSGARRSWLSVGGDLRRLRAWDARSDARAVFTADIDRVLSGCFGALVNCLRAQSVFYAEFLSVQNQLSGYRKFNWTIRLRPPDLFSRLYLEAHVHIFDAFLGYLVREKGLLDEGQEAEVFWPGEAGPVPLRSVRGQPGPQFPSLNHLCLCLHYFGGNGQAFQPEAGAGSRELGRWVSAGRPLFEERRQMERLFSPALARETVARSLQDWPEFRLAALFACELAFAGAKDRAASLLPELERGILGLIGSVRDNDRAKATEACKALQAKLKTMRVYALTLERLGGWLSATSAQSSVEQFQAMPADQDHTDADPASTLSASFGSLHLYVHECVAASPADPQVWAEQAATNPLFLAALRAILGGEEAAQGGAATATATDPSGGGAPTPLTPPPPPPRSQPQGTGDQLLDERLAANRFLADTRRELKEMETITDPGLIPGQRLETLASGLAQGLPLLADDGEAKSLAQGISKLQRKRQKACAQKEKEAEEQRGLETLRLFKASRLYRLLLEGSEAATAEDWARGLSASARKLDYKALAKQCDTRLKSLRPPACGAQWTESDLFFRGKADFFPLYEFLDGCQRVRENHEEARARLELLARRELAPVLKPESRAELEQAEELAKQQTLPVVLNPAEVLRASYARYEAYATLADSFDELASGLTELDARMLRIEQECASLRSTLAYLGPGGGWCRFEAPPTASVNTTVIVPASGLLAELERVAQWWGDLNSALLCSGSQLQEHSLRNAVQHRGWERVAAPLELESVQPGGLLSALASLLPEAARASGHRLGPAAPAPPGFSEAEQERLLLSFDPADANQATQVFVEDKKNARHTFGFDQYRSLLAFLPYEKGWTMKRMFGHYFSHILRRYPRDGDAGRFVDRRNSDPVPADEGLETTAQLLAAVYGRNRQRLQKSSFLAGGLKNASELADYTALAPALGTPPAGPWSPVPALDRLAALYFATGIRVRVCTEIALASAPKRFYRVTFDPADLIGRGQFVGRVTAAGLYGFVATATGSASATGHLFPGLDAAISREFNDGAPPVSPDDHDGHYLLFVDLEGTLALGFLCRRPAGAAKPRAEPMAVKDLLAPSFRSDYEGFARVSRAAQKTEEAVAFVEERGGAKKGPQAFRPRWTRERGAHERTAWETAQAATEEQEDAEPWPQAFLPRGTRERGTHERTAWETEAAAAEEEGGTEPWPHAFSPGVAAATTTPELGARTRPACPQRRKEEEEEEKQQQEGERRGQQAAGQAQQDVGGRRAGRPEFRRKRRTEEEAGGWSPPRATGGHSGFWQGNRGGAEKEEEKEKKKKKKKEEEEGEEGFAGRLPPASEPPLASSSPPRATAGAGMKATPEEDRMRQKKMTSSLRGSDAEECRFGELLNRLQETLRLALVLTPEEALFRLQPRQPPPPWRQDYDRYYKDDDDDDNDL